ncbi:MAG TPA: glutaminyl-peptide cyclotransferase, partial [Promineifilum sp.]
MKLRLIRSLITLLWITLLFAACGNLPGSPIATIAATADLPEINTGAATITQSPAPETQTAPPSPAVATPAPDLEATSLAMTEVAYAAIVASPTATMPTPEIPPTPPAPLTYTFEVVNTFPHDPGAFTEGLVYQDGILFEGTGLWGQSDLREVELETGEVIRSQDLEAQYFGEGVTLFNGRIYQLTWQEHTGFIYEPDTFDLVDTFDYPTEGWGLTHNGQEL